MGSILTISQHGDSKKIKIPESWALCQMGDISKVVGGGTPKTSLPENFSENGIPWITPADLRNYKAIYISSGKRNLSELGLKHSSARILPRNSVLFSSRAPVGYVAIAANELSTNQGFRSFVCSEEIEPKYIYYYLKYIKPLAEDLASGTTFKEISGTKAAKIPLLLPPLNEQHRIVAKLEKLIVKVHQCQARLEKIPGILKRLREAILVAACSGELTKDCRINKKANDEKNRSNNPEGWQHYTIKNLSHYVTSGSRGWAKYYSDNGSYFIRAQDIKTDSLSLDNAAHVNLPDRAEGTRTKIQPGDILITITGANVTKAAMVEKNIGEAYVNQHVALIRPTDPALSKYLHLWITSPLHGRKKLLNDAYGAGKPGLNLDNIRNIDVNMPGKEECRILVKRAETLFHLADQIEHRYHKAKTHIDKLTQSILARAFRGELVPQDPDDEPAAELLERIKKEKERQSFRNNSKRNSKNQNQKKKARA